MIEIRDPEDMSHRAAVCVHSASGRPNSVYLCVRRKAGFQSQLEIAEETYTLLNAVFLKTNQCKLYHIYSQQTYIR
jgi:hypothetical protein